MTNKLNLKKGKLNKLNFIIDLLENSNVSSFYSGLINIETTKEVFYKPKTDNTKLFRGKAFLIDDFPNYLKTELNSVTKSIKQKKINTYQGSLINLKSYNTLDDYLLDKIRTKERAEMRRRQKRLDLCIKPTYKVYYGDISKTEYDIIFNDYKQMLIRRLEQKQSYWEELEYWSERYNSTLELINEKKACIFVIYQNKKPIAIYINSVFDKIIFNEVVAYDIDYSRFNIGILIFIKVIDWSIKNDFDIIDMSKGDFSYKERFKNGNYSFQKHIIYDSNNLFTSIKANLTVYKLKIIYTLLPILKKLKINKLYTIYKRNKKKYFFKSVKQNHNNFIEIEKIKSISSIDNLKQININEQDYLFLKKAFIDFAFLNSEYIDDISVYQNENSKNTFIFKGKKSLQKNIIK